MTAPVNKFYNITSTVLQPLKDSLKGIRKQIISDIDEKLFEGNMENVWEKLNLQYMGMLFSLPRFICWLIVVFGALMASIFTCQMNVLCQALEPRKIVDAYGKVALFSLIYVLGSQLALYNVLSSFGIPFYHIYVKFGTGFVYDVVADALLVSTYIGMSNELFFSIPKKRISVTWTVPGISAPGPNVPNQILA